MLDAGFLIGLERGSRVVADLARELGVHGRPMVTSVGVVAQVWRDGARQARLAAVLRAVEVVPIDHDEARHIGVLLRSSGTSDVVDGHVALVARRRSLPVATSDRGDLERLGVPPGAILDV